MSKYLLLFPCSSAPNNKKKHDPFDATCPPDFVHPVTIRYILPKVGGKNKQNWVVVVLVGLTSSGSSSCSSSSSSSSPSLSSSSSTTAVETDSSTGSDGGRNFSSVRRSVVMAFVDGFFPVDLLPVTSAV